MKTFFLLSLFITQVSSANADIYSDGKFTNVIIENKNGLNGNVVRYTSSCSIRTMIKENANLLYIYEVISDCADLSTVPFPRTMLLTIDGENIFHENYFVGTKIGNEYNILVSFEEEQSSLNRYLNDYGALCPFSNPPQKEQFSGLKSYYQLKMTKGADGTYTLRQSWSSDMIQVTFRKHYRSALCLFEPLLRVGRQTITVEKLVVESAK